MTLECRWSEKHGCEPPEWVVSYICNNCNRTGTAEMCDIHYEYYRALKNIPHSKAHMVCGVCQGTLSYMAQHIRSLRVEEHIQ